MIASLPMYDRPETARANDRLWALVRDCLRAAGHQAPDGLTRSGDPWDHWANPGLVLSQTCGLPFRARLCGRFALVGAPVLDLPGIAPGEYCSVFIAGKEAAGRPLAAFGSVRFAYNDPLSQSGWASPKLHFDRIGLDFASLLRTGAHRASAEAVAEGAADLAALDVLSWAMIRRWDRFAAELVEVARTEPGPALPYVTGLRGVPDTVLAALSEAFATLPVADRDCLGIRGVVRVPADAYLSLPTPPAPGQVSA